MSRNRTPVSLTQSIYYWLSVRPGLDHWLFMMMLSNCLPNSHFIITYFKSAIKSDMRCSRKFIVCSNNAENAYLWYELNFMKDVHNHHTIEEQIQAFMMGLNVFSSLQIFIFSSLYLRSVTLMSFSSPLSIPQYTSTM